MNIDFENAKTVNITKMWEGHLEDGTNFTINGGWNDFEGYYVDSIDINGFTGSLDESNKLEEEIRNKFLNEMN
jgi:hypothetical protein